MKFVAVLCVLAASSVTFAVPSPELQPALWPKNPGNMEQMSMKDLVKLADENTNQVMMGDMIYNDDNCLDLFKMESAIEQKSHSMDDHQQQFWYLKGGVIESRISIMTQVCSLCMHHVESFKRFIKECDDFMGGNKPAPLDFTHKEKYDEIFQMVQGVKCKSMHQYFDEIPRHDVIIVENDKSLYLPALSTYEEYRIANGYQISAEFDELKATLLKKLTQIENML